MREPLSSPRRARRIKNSGTARRADTKTTPAPAMRVLALLLAAACAADAEGPASAVEAPPPRTIRHLESLVDGLASLQDAGESAREQAMDDEMLMLESGMETMAARGARAPHRRLYAACVCDVFEEGAAYGAPYCAETVGGQTVCRLRCSGDMVACGHRELRPNPSPHARARSLEEVESAASDAPAPVPTAAAPVPTAVGGAAPASAYLSFSMELAVANGDDVPADATFEQALGGLLDLGDGTVAARYVSGDSRSAGPRRRLGKKHAMLYATVGLASESERDELSQALRKVKKLHLADGTVFAVEQLQIFAEQSHPIVCSKEVEDLKEETSALVAELMELKQAELQLMRDALAKNEGTCVFEPVSAIAAHLGARTR